MAKRPPIKRHTTKKQQTTKTISGVFQHHPSGRGFVDWGEAHEDIVVEFGDQGAALDGDTVEVSAWPGRNRDKGRIEKVLKRGRTRLTGMLCGETLRLDDPRIKAPVIVVDSGPASQGQAVLASITEYPSGPASAIKVSITRVLGEPGLLKTEVAKCIAAAGVDEQFSQSVIETASTLPRAVLSRDKTDRLDLRDHHFVTIDPQTARDFDDAIAVEERPGETIRVWIAVADVSHYVPEGSILDQEARHRGCSIYLPNRAIPMLPERLSSRICSLVPRRDRLAMVVRLDISKSGQIVDQDCAAAVIHSRGQLDYNGVAAALKGDFEGLRATYREHATMLHNLKRVAWSLKRQRLQRGSLDLDLPEATVVLDEDDPERIRDIVQSKPDNPIKQAYNLVEELMIAANEAVARHFQRADRSPIWRIHPPPHSRALRSLCVWMKSYGVKIAAKALRSEKEMSSLVERLRGHPASRPLCYLVLRTLKQATYSVNNEGHFGLASPAYLHFTSPIRRYPDLHVHRLLKALLRQQGKPSGRAQPVRQMSLKALDTIAKGASVCERQAIEVEREVHRLFAASAMRDRLGDEGWGTVSGVNTFGFFVTLDRPFVDGLVKLSSIPQHLSFDPDQLRLVGQGRSIALGQRLQVKVVNTSVARRQIDLELLEDETAPGRDVGDRRKGHARRSQKQRGSRRKIQGRRKSS